MAERRPPHPDPPPRGGRGLDSPSPLAGEGRGGGRRAYPLPFEVGRMRKLIGLFLLTALACLGGAQTAPVRAAETKIVLIAGKPSHGPGAHEFNAGTKLLAKCLGEIPGIDPVFVAGGWPEDESVFQGAKAVVFFMDGGKNHPMIQGAQRMETMRRM